MKTIASILMVIIFSFTICNPTEAQIKNPFKKAKQEAEKKANKEIDKGIENAMNPEEQAKEENKQQQDQQQTKDNKPQDVPENQEQPEEAKSHNLTWAKYDFVPGEEVFFEDNQEGEENGEFPSRWDIYSGNVENAQLGGENVIMFRENSYIMPYLENAESAYLPDVFTLEFDCFFNLKENYQHYNVIFYDKLNQRSNDLPEVNIYWNRIVAGRFEGNYPGLSASGNSEFEGWKHISLSFNKRALKVYMDDTRIINIPNLKTKPTGISIWGQFNPYNEKYSYIKNIRLAKGGVKLYDRMMQDGKIIATGIRFDSGKATLKPESMGIINTIAEMMEEHPELKFSIEGHTDSDGDMEANQKLSEERAITVMNTLIEMGIAPDRLSTKGFGESNPIAANNTSEGKANNRRVEFVKI
jgi:outer membrane protein OmpA-like peptidoglycan-associated protein